MAVSPHREPCADALPQIRSRKEQLTEDGELPEQIINGRNVLTSFPILDRLALDEAIAKLAPGYRAVFILHDIEGLQHIEIANIMGCSVGTSKSQLYKARMKMRSLLLSKSQRFSSVLNDNSTSITEKSMAYACE